MFGQERNEAGVGHQGESLCRRGGQHGGFVVEQEQNALTGACRVQDSSQHAVRRVGELVFPRQRGAEVRQRFHRMQQPTEIVGLNRHRRSGSQIAEQVEGSTREAPRARAQCWLV